MVSQDDVNSFNQEIREQQIMRQLAYFLVILEIIAPRTAAEFLYSKGFSYHSVDDLTNKIRLEIFTRRFP